MIIKFRDSTIKKLNQKDKMSDEQSADELEKAQKEVDCLWESIDQNPKLAKLFSDNESLIRERNMLKMEVDDSLESMSHQYKSTMEFTDELWMYFKEYIEKDLVGQEALVSKEVKRVEEELTTQFEAKMAELKTELSEMTAVNEQLREESEEQHDRIRQLKEEIRTTKEEAEIQIEIKEQNLKESLSQVREEIKETKDGEIKDIKIKLVEESTLKEEITRELEKEKTKGDDLEAKYDKLWAELEDVIKQSEATVQQMEEKEQEKNQTIDELVKERDEMKTNIEWVPVLEAEKDALTAKVNEMTQQAQNDK